MKSNNLEAIYVMWLREMKRFFRAKSRIIGSLAMPFFFLLAMGFGFNSSFRFSGVSQEINYLDYLVPGIIGMTLLFSSIITGISVLWDKEFGFLKEIMVAPVKRWAIVLGRITGGITTALVQGILILVISLFMGFRFTNFFGLILAFLLMLLIGIGFVGFGIAIASEMEDTQGFSLIMQFIIFPTFFLSGALFPINNFPNWLRSLSLINPLTYGVDALRVSLIGFSQFSLFIDFGILLLFDLTMIALASYFFSKTEI